MRKEQRIPKSKIPEAIEALKALDKKELDDVPAREAIKNMRRQIERVLKLGYTYEEVSETLAGLDINISPQRIKYFLAEIRKKKKKKSNSQNNKDHNSNSSQNSDTSTENTDVITAGNNTGSNQNIQSGNSSQNTDKSKSNIDAISTANNTGSNRNRHSSNSPQNISDSTENKTDDSNNEYGFKPVIVNPEDL